MKKRRKEKKKLNFKCIYLLLFAVVTIIFITFIKIINVIPTLYFIILLILTIGLYILSFFLLKKKKKIGYVISGILIVIYLLVTYYLGITMNFFNSFSKIRYNEETYLVLSLKDTYKDIKEIKDKNLGYVENDLNNINKAIEKLDKKVTTNKQVYEDNTSLFKDLDDKKIDALLTDETYYNIKKEEEGVDNYQILYKIKVRTIVKEKNKTVDITKDPFTIYISGIDVYGNIETVSRSDVNILMTVNPTTKQILLTSIPRDYYVQLAGTSGYKDKLTHAGNYGINMSIDTIEKLLDIDINYYVRVNFTTLEKLIDAIDGVDVYSEYSFVSYIDSYKFYKGYNHMNGKQALAFSRERKSLPSGDIERGRNQEAVIEAIIRKATSGSTIYKYSKILSNIKGTFQTNISETDITKLIKKELSNIGGWNITSTNLDGTGSSEYTYSYSGQKLYVMIPNEKSITETKAQITKVINGDKLNSSYSNSIGNIQNPSKVNPEPEQNTAPTPSNNNKQEENTIDKKDNVITKEENTTKEPQVEEDNKKDDNKEDNKKDSTTKEEDNKKDNTENTTNNTEDKTNEEEANS